jgi:maleate cis-trans isomerase
MSREPTIAELKALADHARERVALYRRRVYLGRGTQERLAELERVAHGAAERLARARRSE